MKKINLILKKAELFEKMANYGKRSDFLKALAQINASKRFNDAIVLINQISTLLSSKGLFYSQSATINDTSQEALNKLKQLLPHIRNLNGQDLHTASQKYNEASSAIQECMEQNNTYTSFMPAYHQLPEVREDVDERSPVTLDEVKIRANPPQENEFRKYYNALYAGVNEPNFQLMMKYLPIVEKQVTESFYNNSLSTETVTKAQELMYKAQSLLGI